VLEDGSLANLKLVRGLGYGLDESAILTIQDRWRFQPGTVDGKPVNVEANIEIKTSGYISDGRQRLGVPVVSAQTRPQPDEGCGT
jgi:Gram-negative bacterial TonB protein C-terminal